MRPETGNPARTLEAARDRVRVLEAELAEARGLVAELAADGAPAAGGEPGVLDEPGVPGEPDALAARFGAGFLTHVPVLAWVKDPSGCHLFANRTMHRRFGVAEGALVGRGVAGLGFEEEEVERLRRHDQEVLDSGQPFRGIERVTMPGETPRDWFVVKFPLPAQAGSGEPLLLTGGMAVEVTEELAWQEQLEMALEASRSGTWAWERTDGGPWRLRFSERCWRMLGLEPEAGDVSPESWGQRVHPEDLPDVSERLRRVLAGEAASFRAQARFRRADGGWRWVETVGRPIRHAGDGKPLKMVGLHLDIHRLKATETALAERNAELLDEVSVGADRLEESEARFRSMAKDSPLMLWFTQDGAETPWINPALEGFLEGVDGDARGVVRDWIARLVAAEPGDGTTGLRQEVPHTDGDGRRRWILLHGRPRQTPAGRMVGHMGTVLDVTEQHEAREALVQSKARLEEEVRARTAELQERLAELAERNRELDHFAHVASHDLRSPLRTILGFANCLEPAVADDPEAAGYLQRMLGAGGRMRELLDSLLAFASVGRGEVADRPVDLDAVLRQAIEDLGAEIQRLGARVDLRPLPEIRGDETMIRQAFQNLLANALKYAGEGPPRVRVEAEETGGGGVRVTVGDAGTGFAPEAAERLFEPFKRFHREDTPGSGVGLSIVKRVVERHGGRVWAEVVPGLEHPTRFHLEFPVGGGGGRGAGVNPAIRLAATEAGGGPPLREVPGGP